MRPLLFMTVLLGMACATCLTAAEEHWYQIERHDPEHGTYPFYGTCAYDFDTLLARIADEEFIIIDHLTYRNDDSYYRWSTWVDVHSDTMALRTSAIVSVTPLSGDPAGENGDDADAGDGGVLLP